MPNDSNVQAHPLTQESVTLWAKRIVGMVIALAATTTAWLTLGLPVPATTAYVIAEVRPVANEVASLKLIVLQGRKGQLIEELLDLKEEQRLDPNNRLRRQLITIKEREVDTIEKQIDELDP